MTMIPARRWTIFGCGLAAFGGAKRRQNVALRLAANAASVDFPYLSYSRVAKHDQPLLVCPLMLSPLIAPLKENRPALRDICVPCKLPLRAPERRGP